MREKARSNLHCLLERLKRLEVAQIHNVVVNGVAEIKPFHLYHNIEEPHLDPVRAILGWIRHSRIREGYIFRRIMADDRITAENKPLVRNRSHRPHFKWQLMFCFKQTQELFTEYFRHNLLDISVDFTPYGTHSFRRGGCQYLSTERRWGIRKLCDWGGWSTDFDNLTIVRYLMSWNDDPMMQRENFLNPELPAGVVCNYCGRKCDCFS